MPRQGGPAMTYVVLFGAASVTHGVGHQPRPAPEHGSLTSYTGGKCRCDLCREGWRLYMRELRATHKLLGRRAG